MVLNRTPNPLEEERRKTRYGNYKDLAVVYEGRSEEIPVRLPDVSPHGMFIVTPRRFAEGTVLTICFRLSRSNYQVRARGEVRFVLPGVGIGVEFMEISSEAQLAILDEFRVK
jgi:hypothetical protein